MQNKPSIMEIVNSNNVTTEDALKIIDALSAEDIIQQDTTGATILHHLCFGREVWSFKFDLAQVIEKIVSKNPAILTLKWNDLKTPIYIAITENDLEAVKILAPYYAKAKHEVIIRERMKLLAPRTDLGDLDIASGGEEVIDEIVAETSALSYCLKHGQIKMLQILYREGFKELEGIEDLSKYNLSDPTKENLQALYKDLFVAGKKEELAGLHRHLGYYEGHEGKNSEELIAAVSADNQEEALKLISQGHYIYDFSGCDLYNKVDKKILDFFFLNNLHHPNYNFLAKDKYGNTPWQFAVRHGGGKSVLALIEATKGNPALLNTLFAPEKDGNTPLHLAVDNGHKEIAVLILEAAKGNQELLKTLFASNHYKNTPLHLAARNGRKEIAVLLLEGAKGNPELLKTLFSPDRDGYTPLHLVAQSGHNEVMVSLLEAAKGNGIDLKTLFAHNKHGNTPLHLVARNGLKEIAVLILEAAKGNSIDLKTLFAHNKHGNTPLHLVAQSGHNEAIVLLLEAAKGNGIDLKTLFARNKYGNTPLHLVAASGHNEVMVFLLEAAKGNGIDLKILFARNEYGNTPLHLVAQSGHNEAIVLLLEAAKGNGIDLKTLFAHNKDGNTPLHLVARNGHKEIAVLILEAAKGNMIDLKTLFTPEKDGNTPLHLAVENGHKEVAKELLKCDELDLLCKNRAGRTAADVAKNLETKGLIEENMRERSDRARALHDVGFSSSSNLSSSTAMPTAAPAPQVYISAIQLPQRSTDSNNKQR